MAISSTKSTGCNMSERQRGISIKYSSSPAAASAHLFRVRGPSVTTRLRISLPPIILSATAISLSPNSLPNTSSSRGFGKRWVRGLPFGEATETPSQPVNSMLSTAPPLTASDRHTSNRVASQARSSHPVTSMKKSVVDSVTVVCAPLMIGGKERTSPAASIMTGNFSNPSSKCAYSTPLGCVVSISSMVILCSIASGMKE